ncbi:hypothetical protein MtrunA17_Chr4g0064721 [Medicago truncatula]|uniref:Transmembrane protein n=1 Tax=Medicago truncatula TaxID=3880 RepID=A0A396IEM6_MEDTR|nr:hypothetical protein MtrunA17_Chr4g0064721 [Medicago truncatula]
MECSKRKIRIFALLLFCLKIESVSCFAELFNHSWGSSFAVVSFWFCVFAYHIISYVLAWLSKTLLVWLFSCW